MGKNMKKRIPFQKVRYDEKRQKILTNAGRLFARKGYEKASLDEIAAKLRLTKATLYHYIKSKEDMLFQIQYIGIKQAKQGLDEVISSDLGTVEKLREAVKNHVRTTTREDVIGALRQAELVLPPQLRKQIIAERDRYQETFLSLIQEGVKKGIFEQKHWKINAFAVFGAMNWITRWYSTRGNLSPEEIGDVMAGFILKGLTKN
jgi:AcrR family transcriptional regulator